MSNYWDGKYREGSVNCRGSRGRFKRWKWRFIESVIGDLRRRTVIDVGCGDARFWKWRPKPRHYIGIDISERAIEIAQKVIPEGVFYQNNSSWPHRITAENVLCLDVIFHLMDRETVEMTLANLCEYSLDKVFIYDWLNDPSPYDESFQKFWDLDDFTQIFEDAGFSLREVRAPPFDPVGAMFLYQYGGGSR